MIKRAWLGEFLGTFILVLFGCGSVAVDTLFEAHGGNLALIALIWGAAVTLAIYLTRHLSCAHLNPAVSISMAVSGRMYWSKLPGYLIAQFLGAFVAGWAVYALFAPQLEIFEAAKDIVRGAPESVKTARMFGEFYNGTLLHAAGAEFFGTFLLVLAIFGLTEGCNVGRPDNSLAPVFIGMTVASIICLVAPLTQAGLNPARDFSPRCVAWICGWGKAAFPDSAGGFFHVYILAPILGGLAASGLFMAVIEPALKTKQEKCSCQKD